VRESQRKVSVESMRKPKAVTADVKSGLPAIHPGEFLREVLEERGLSQAQFARAIGVSAVRVS
jgi:DNA-binding transcriptional regulator YiaG